MAEFDSERGLAQLVEAKRVELVAPLEPPTGHFEEARPDAIFAATRAWTAQFSRAATQVLLSHPAAQTSVPVLMGSWARGELLPKSDLDIGFLGDASASQEITRDMQRAGLKIRPRQLTVDGIREWPLLEQLSLLEVEPLLSGTTWPTPELVKYFAGLRKQKRAVVSAMTKERAQRRERDGFENLLEPQLKAGLGGQRDQLQARQLFRLFPELWPDEHAQHVVEYNRWFLTTIRLKLHLLGAGDFMQATLQPELSTWFGFDNWREFMKHVQLMLSRTLFYADWACDWCLANANRRKQITNSKWSSAPAMLRSLEKDSSILNQFQVRRLMDDLRVKDSFASPKVKPLIQRALIGTSNEKVLRALFRSRLLDRLDPRLRRLVGYNQHDQYHAYTADAHILNILLEYKRVFQSPRRVGKLASLVRRCSALDRSLIAWACYYHDLAKGLEGDHEKVALDFVKKDAKTSRATQRWVEEVCWLVEHHLRFSKAAFRQDLADEATLLSLVEMQLTPGRIRRLAVFTALDIRATHPKAWTPWKEALLVKLVEHLTREHEGPRLIKRSLLQKKYGVELSSVLIDGVGYARLDRDLALLQQESRKLGPKPSELETSDGSADSAQAAFRIYPVRGGYWVRYLDRRDLPGVLVQALGMLFQAGCSVIQAVVGSFEGLGVYDWFLVETGSERRSLERRLMHLYPSELEITATWKSVEWVSVGPQSWSFLCKGIDQRGLLYFTAAKLFAMGVQVKAARIQTWGRQVEDVFDVEPVVSSTPDAFLQELTRSLVEVDLGKKG